MSDIQTSGYRWPDFSAEFKDRWHRELLGLLRGNSGGETFQADMTPNLFRCDVHFWREMRIWAGMAKAYADLGGDAVKGLASALLKASQDNSRDKRTYEALLAAVNSPEVVALALAAVDDMRMRIGAEPSTWAREHLAAEVGKESPAVGKKLEAMFSAELGYSERIKTLIPLVSSNEN